MYIVIEGVDGIGKTTLAKGLMDYYKNNGKNVVFTREPGGTELGEELRKILKEGKAPRDKLQELFLFSAARAASMQNIKENLRINNDVVIADRSYISTIAYQAENEDDVRFIENISFEIMQRYGTVPDKIIILKHDNLKSVMDREQRLVTGDNFEDGKVETMKKRQDAYVNYYNKSVGRKFANHQMILLDVTGLEPEQTLDAAIVSMTSK